MTKRRINIVYHPGHAGNLLHAMFSLDPMTRPFSNQCRDLGSPLARAHHYTSTPAAGLRHLGDVRSEGPDHMIYAVTIDNVTVNCFDLDRLTDQTLLVQLDHSDFANYWVVKFRANNDYQIGRAQFGDAEKFAKLEEMPNIDCIDLGQFLDKGTWITEYTRINGLIGLPSYVDCATIVFDYWFRLRVQPYLDSFAKLSEHDKLVYRARRTQEEAFGSPTTWQIFYDRIKDPAWPSCDTEEDFQDLPTEIQHEIIKFFGYTPKPMDFYQSSGKVKVDLI